MYIYCEVFEDSYIVLTHYSHLNGQVLFEDTYYSWNEIIGEGWFDRNIPIHISPDLFSPAGIANSDWQVENSN